MKTHHEQKGTFMNSLLLNLPVRLLRFNGWRVIYSLHVPRVQSCRAVTEPRFSKASDGFRRTMNARKPISDEP